MNVVSRRQVSFPLACMAVWLVLGGLASTGPVEAAEPFYIEAEDYDYEGGRHVAPADHMPYLGGAYAGVTARAEIDYHRPTGGATFVYRNDPDVPMDANPLDLQRSDWSVNANFKLINLSTGQWFNYTREFPPGQYQVFAALSHRVSRTNVVRGSLQRVTGGAGTVNQEVQALGTFDGPGLGQYGRNSLVALLDAGGEPVGLGLNGLATLRFTADSGQFDYLALIPVPPPDFAQSPADLTVMEGDEARFSVALVNAAGAAYQWQSNRVSLPGAVGAVFTFRAPLSASGQAYRCVVTNAVGTNISQEAVLTVTPDIVKPRVARVQNEGRTTLLVVFSEPVDAAAASSTGSYRLDRGVKVTQATLGEDLRTVRLTVSPALEIGLTYNLTVNGIQDRAVTPNTILPNSVFTFLTFELTLADIGGAQVPGSILAAGQGFDVSGSGVVGGVGDQCQFSHSERTGDFDLAVRVESVGLTDVWAMAGLMAREDLTAGSRSVSALTSPSMVGCLFQYRETSGSPAVNTGTFPPNFPEMWLRLQRAGNTFTGYAGYDGRRWTRLGSVNMALAPTLKVGYAASSQNPARPATARFRDPQPATSVAVGRQPTPLEPPGPSTRRTGLVISEIMYRPAPRADGKDLEFVEIYNSNPMFEDLSGHRLSGDIDFKFPPGTLLPGGGHLVVAHVPADLISVYGLTNVAGPYTNTLKSSGLVRLRSEIDAVLLEVPYLNESPWPVGASGTGHSIVLARPSFGETDGRAWSLSDRAGGSPGTGEAWRPGPLRGVVINEFLAHTDPPLYDYIELYNRGDAVAELSGCILTDDLSTNRFVVPAGTRLQPGEFVSFDELELGFRLDAEGETLHLFEPDRVRVLDAVRFDGQENAVSMGRHPDGGVELYPLRQRTPGDPNGPILVRDVVLNEIMYHPISGNDDDQFVELYNQGDGAVDLSGWRFVAGIDYVFPTNTSIARGSYLVVGRNATNLLANHPQLNPGNTLGDFKGRLAGGGERLALARPEILINTNTPGVTKTNLAYIVVDEVTYGTGGRWGEWADGGGSSLELIDPRSNHRLAGNWADSDETHKSEWTTIEATGVLDNGAGYNGEPVNRVQAGLLGAGECLLDDVEARPGTSGPNYLSNADFEGGLGPWTREGDHARSTLETSEGHGGSRSLHLRASDTMWTGANYVSCSLTGALDPYAVATLRLQARWLRGWPEILMRVNGNWLEATGRLQVPRNLGTPGLPNGRAAANGAPAIGDVTHAPSLPEAGEPVVVTARVDDPDGLQTVSLRYRVGPSGGEVWLSMVDNGTGGDRLAGDGIYSATIPGQGAGTLVAFIVRALDARGAASLFPADPADQAPVRECAVVFGDLDQASGFGSYHYWLTQSNINRWGSLGNLSNEPIDGTWVCGSRVIYNMFGHFAGSPYHQQFNTPNGSYCHYNLRMPKDDRFLGVTSFNKIHAPGNGPFDDATLQREQTAYSLVRQLGLPWNYRRYVALFVNGARRGTLMEDTQVPGSDVIREQFPDDSDGTLYKLQPWFEFDRNGQSFNNQSWCMLNDYTTTDGAKKLARYRWNYLPRAVDGSANNYSNVFTLIDTANTPDSRDFRNGMLNLVDMEQWMRTFAVEHAVGNWDAVGSYNEQNMYSYKPNRGRWVLFIWDYNIVLGNSGSWGPGENLFAVQWEDYPMLRMFYYEPEFQRAYWRGLRELALGPMDLNRVGPAMDARYSAFLAEKLSVASPDSTKSWIASAATSILSQSTDAGGNLPFTVQGPLSFATDSSLVTLNGSAPFEVESILVNGRAYPVTWNSVTDWSLTLAVSGAQNTWLIQGRDNRGRLVTGAATTINVTYTGVVERPQDHVVINEIMYNPLAPDAAFVELHNTSTRVAFDLTACRLEGADFTFPAGSILLPGGFLVVANDAEAFAAAYGPSIPLAGEFQGRLQNGGETLKLVAPGATPEADVLLDEVTYDSTAPWPVLADGFGPSLQLIDPLQDNNRVMNWAAVDPAAPPPAPEWQFVTVTGQATTSRLYVYLQSAGDVFIDDLQLVEGGVPGAGVNLVANGDFEAPLAGSWNTNPNTANSMISSDQRQGGGSSLHLVCADAGSTQSNALWQDTAPLVIGNTYTLSYWYLPSPNGSSLVMRLSGSSASSGIYSAHPIAPDISSTPVAYTPGGPNSVLATLPAFPALWLNELQPHNTTGPVDNAGEHEPWLEIYNSGTSALDLAGFHLSDTPTNLMRWAFPALTLQPGEFRVVWADGQPGQTSPGDLHADFRLASTNGTVILSHATASGTNVMDYLHYPALNLNRSYGAFPDGTATKRRRLYFATPGEPNTDVYPEAPIRINEWMAANSKAVADPADGLFPDWFELHNGGPVPVDLSGYTLTDDLTDWNQFVIPEGCVIPADGFLVVWADGDLDQNVPGQPDLHVNFKLSQGADRIALYNPNRVLIDSVEFVNQVSDVSEGRWPDGNDTRYVLAAPTPGAPNLRQIGSNHAPTLTTPARVAVYAGAELRLNTTATDPDVGQSLTFSLDPGAPAGVLINAHSGILTWTPAFDQPAGAYPVVIRVTDDGVPPMDDWAETTLEVNTPAPLKLTRAAHDPDGALRLRWSSQPGMTYRLEYKNDLTAPAWLDFGDYPATGTTTEAVDDTLGSAERYYRVRRLP